MTGTRTDLPYCLGVKANGWRCANRVRPGSRYCAMHLAQRPREPLDYLVERVSARTPHPHRVHLAYTGRDTLLCTGSRARPLGGPMPGAPVCDRCRAAALTAVGHGELEPDTLRRFRLGEPNVDEARP